ncbi:MAG: SOS response-associated peptidase [Chloroflexota bacterium]|nr:SOS response-associated peptidase [Chloroflexota bacterium]
MCGRYATTTTDAGVLRERFAVQQGLETFVPSRNVKPTQEAAVVTMQDGQRNLAAMRWGLIPPWARDATIASKTFNARAETVADKPSFRQAFRRRRCLVPATGFYEWQQEGRRKVPYQFVVGAGELFAFAGLHETWQSPSGEQVQTYTIITTDPNDLVAPIHNRMPVILPRDVEAVWLDPQFEDMDYLQSLLVPYPSHAMQMRPVDGTL